MEKILPATVFSRTFLVFAFFCLCFSPSFARAAYYNDYSDTLLVVNDNSTTSVAIGAYFKAARNLSDSQIVHISTVTTETVSRTEFENNIKGAIESFMDARNIASTTNYIILTKGIPIRITDTSNSVDSTLAWCLEKSDSCDSQTSEITNPFYGSDTIFSHEAYDMYIVTRLDGYASSSVSGIEAMIDREAIANIASPVTLKSQGVFVLDGGGSYDGLANPMLESANTLLTAKG